MAFSILLTVLLAATGAYAMPNPATALPTSNPNLHPPPGAAVGIAKPTTTSKTAAATAKAFILHAEIPGLEKTVGTRLVPFNTEFYLGGGLADGGGIIPVEGCSKAASKKGQCSRDVEPTFIENGGGSLALNTTVPDRAIAGFSQAVYIHFSGALRFLLPPEFLVQDDELYGSFKIVKGVAGKNDTLVFAGYNHYGYHNPAAPFYLCAYDQSNSKTKLSVYQVYVGTAQFHATRNTANCTEFVPQIEYLEGGAYEWA